MNLPEVITHCYCCVCDTESHMLQCEKCKRLFHPSCLKSDRPSNLVGDIFFKFTCANCSEDREECIERMKLQWIHVVVLTLYNLQLQGGGKCGYFRWREHICNFIDHNWNTFFKGVRKKTTTWHGTVAGTLSQGCPQFFRSGTEVLGESGWWALDNNRLPTLQELEPRSPSQKSARRSKVATIDSSPVVGGLRMRRKTSIIQAAVELKEKKLIVQERKKLRTSKGAQKAQLIEDDALTNDPIFSDENEETGSTSCPPQIKTNTQDIQPSLCSPVGESEITRSRGKRKTTEIIRLKADDNVDISSPIEVSSSSNEMTSIHEWLKMEADDEMEDLEIDFEPSTDICKPNPPQMNDLLSFMPEDVSKEETDVEETDVEESLEETGLSDIKDENSEESEEDTKDSINNNHSTQVSSIPEVGRKRKAVTREVTVTKEQEIQEPKCVLMNYYEEEQLLKKLERLSEAVERNAVARRLRRKLIVRQLKRDANLPLFNIDMEIQNYSESMSPINETNQDIFKGNQTCIINGVDYRILDRFQVGSVTVQSRSFRHASFVTRLMGFEGTQKDCIISPYTTRVLQPLIFRDYESVPLKLKLLQEIVSHYHRTDPKWTAPQRHPIVYCYVRPQHIPIVNALCHEFFWPGIDLSECLEYPDFSCISLYKKVIIGFAFMVPDVKYNEAYISFIFTHPEWRRAGIATFMLYHLIQTCMGKDVTLHVSATNPALLLYQKFGFKIEEFILDFYEKYHPPNSQECRHAMFLRLSR